MSIVTACKLLNQSNKIEIEEFFIGTEWNDLKIKVIIIRKNNTVLIGEIFLDEFSNYAKTFDKTLSEYLKDTENILSGKADEVDFFLEDQQFFWKRKVWYLGRVHLTLVTEDDHLKDFTIILIDQYSKIKTNVLELEKKNEKLKTKNSCLINKLDEIINLKEELEKKLYKKFCLLINTKKAKIRELQSKLDKLEIKDSIYDATTDDSDNEDEQEDISHCNLMKNPVNKRLKKIEISEEINEKKQTIETTIKKVDFVHKTNILPVNTDTTPIESKNNINVIFDLEGDEETPDILFDESECEVELKFEEETAEVQVNDKICKVTQEDSEEEMF